AAQAESRVAELRALAEDTEALEPGAEERLRNERERLRHVGELAEAAATAAEALAPEEGEGAAGLAGRAERSVAPLERIAPELQREERRRDRAPACAAAVAGELRDVGMGEGEFLVELRERDPGSTGRDEATFLVRPNAGLPFAPVAETASGGELSRIALAIAA